MAPTMVSDEEAVVAVVKDQISSAKGLPDEVIKSRVPGVILVEYLRKIRQLENLNRQWQEIDLIEQRPELEATCAFAEKRLKEIGEAIERYLSGQARVCVDCGELIEPERLEALPTTTLCIPCAVARPLQVKLGSTHPRVRPVKRG